MTFLALTVSALYCKCSQETLPQALEAPVSAIHSLLVVLLVPGTFYLQILAELSLVACVGLETCGSVCVFCGDSEISAPVCTCQHDFRKWGPGRWPS